VIVASSSPDRIDAALERLPTSAEGYTVNVRREEEIRDLFNRLGSFDHLAFTAGETLQIGAIADTDLDAARRALEVRVWGAYAAVKHAVPHFRPGGSIVLTSGIAGTRPEREWTVAASICGALDALTRALAVELAPLRVDAAGPGVVRSDLWRDMRAGPLGDVRLAPIGAAGRARRRGQRHRGDLPLPDAQRLQQRHDRHGRRRLGARLMSKALITGAADGLGREAAK
jgi:NAD(P)-dependent dehydrogenase (short-subunit alcohol dehydrogenase family)